MIPDPSTVAVVTVVHPCFDGRVFHRVALALSEAGFFVELIAPPPTPSDTISLPDRLRHIRLRPRLGGVLGRIEKCVRAGVELSRSHARTWHVHDPELVPVVVALKAILRRPVRLVYDVHENLPVHIRQRRPRICPLALWRAFSAATERIENTLARKCDLIVAATPTIAERFSGLGVESCVARNYPIADWTGQTPIARRPSDPLEVIYVGGVSVQRGILELVDVAERLRDERVRVTVIGRWDDQDLSERITSTAPKNLRIVSQIPFVEVRTHLLASHVGVVCLHPTEHHEESLPVKLFEYLAAGLPVIASDFPAWRSIIESADAGFLVDPLDVDAIVGSLRTLAEDEALRSRLGRNAARAAIEQYSWAPEAARMIAHYRTLVGIPAVSKPQR